MHPSVLPSWCGGGAQDAPPIWPCCNLSLMFPLLPPDPPASIQAQQNPSSHWPQGASGNFLHLPELQFPSLSVRRKEYSHRGSIGTSIPIYIQTYNTMAQQVKNLTAMQEIQEMQIQSLDWEDPLEEEISTHSSILAWRIPCREETGGLQFTGLQRMRHNWAYTHAQVYGSFMSVDSLPHFVSNSSLSDLQ